MRNMSPRACFGVNQNNFLTANFNSNAKSKKNKGKGKDEEKIEAKESPSDEENDAGLKNETNELLQAAPPEKSKIEIAEERVKEREAARQNERDKTREAAAEQERRKQAIVALSENDAEEILSEAKKKAEAINVVLLMEMPPLITKGAAKAMILREEVLKGKVERALKKIKQGEQRKLIKETIDKEKHESRLLEYESRDNLLSQKKIQASYHSNKQKKNAENRAQKSGNKKQQQKSGDNIKKAQQKSDQKVQQEVKEKPSKDVPRSREEVISREVDEINVEDFKIENDQEEAKRENTEDRKEENTEEDKCVVKKDDSKTIVSSEKDKKVDRKETENTENCLMASDYSNNDKSPRSERPNVKPEGEVTEEGKLYPQEAATVNSNAAGAAII